MQEEQLLAPITLNPRVMIGKPVIRGTRLTVEYILSLVMQQLLDNHGDRLADQFVVVTETAVRFTRH